MRRETFDKNQAKRFEKFLAKFRKELQKKYPCMQDYIFCKYRDGYLFGDNTHFEYAKVSDVADDLKQYEKDSFNHVLEAWKRLNYRFSSAEVTPGFINGKKAYAISNQYGTAYVNGAYLPGIESNMVFKLSTTNQEKSPIEWTFDGEVYGYILPIYKPNFTEKGEA